jgi:hypothetical protein
MLAALFLAGVACHRNRDAETEHLTTVVDGAYRLLIDVPGVYLTGRFVVADTQVFLEVDSDCEFVESPNSTDGMRSTWYECDRTAEGAFFQLRISQVDPLKKSFWYARIRVPDRRTVCPRYSIYGECIEGVYERRVRWIERYGAIIVTRGLAGAPPDSNANLTLPRAPGPLRARCDTTAFTKGCEQ